jgi:hypothetical protein
MPSGTRTDLTARRKRARVTPPLPAAVRKEIARFARELSRNARPHFMADPKLKDRAARLLRSLLPPRPRRRGRPGRPDVTLAIRLLHRLKRQYPGERAEQVWRRVYPEVILNYAGMTEVERVYAREMLRLRVGWRRRATPLRKKARLG